MPHESWSFLLMRYSIIVRKGVLVSFTITIKLSFLLKKVNPIFVLLSLLFFCYFWTGNRMASQDHINDLHFSPVVWVVNKADATHRFHGTFSYAPQNPNPLLRHCSHRHLLLYIDSILQEADGQLSYVSGRFHRRW